MRERTTRQSFETQRPRERTLRPSPSPPALGSPLSAEQRRALDATLGHDFTRLRVFGGPAGERIAGPLRADAVAIGSNIFLSADAPAIDTVAGGLLLAHEAAHVAQFDRALPGSSARTTLGPAGAGAEREADGAALSMLTGAPASISAQPGAGYALADRGWFSRFTSGLMQEGLGGILDYSGMMDRQDAQDELSSRFRVASGDDLNNAVAGNVVSEEDYEKIARTYSDIRLGRSDIEFSGKTRGDDGSGGTVDTDMTPEDAEAYKTAAMSDIADLLQTRSGRGMLDALAYQKDDHKTRLYNRPDNSNAEGGADNDAPAGSWSDGTGGNASVTYVPGDAGGIVDPTATDRWLPMRSDVTLMHELTHAYHAAHGSLAQGTVGTDIPAEDSNDVGADEMEYQAVGLGKYASDDFNENAYRFERMLIGGSNVGERTTGGVTDDAMPLRGNYNSHDPSTPGPADSPVEGGSTVMPFLSNFWKTITR
jgi:hypothetical protein